MTRTLLADLGAAYGLALAALRDRASAALAALRRAPAYRRLADPVEAALEAARRARAYRYLADREYLEDPLPLTAAAGAALVLACGASDPQNLGPALVLVAVCVVQNTAFSLTSRSRNRDNKLYHAAAAVGSNGVYFATLAYMVSLDLAPWLVVPYVVGTVNGSLVGADLSMWIERKIGATSDGHLQTA